MPDALTWVCVQIASTTMLTFILVSMFTEPHPFSMASLSVRLKLLHEHDAFCAAAALLHETLLSKQTLLHETLLCQALLNPALQVAGYFVQNIHVLKCDASSDSQDQHGVPSSVVTHHGKASLAEIVRLCC